MELSILKQLILHDGIQEILNANAEKTEQLYGKVIHNNNITQIMNNFAKKANHP